MLFCWFCHVLAQLAQHSRQLVRFFCNMIRMIIMMMLMEYDQICRMTCLHNLGGEEHIWF